MSTRSPSRILDDWRALERRIADEGDVDMAAELGALRDEYAHAVEARRSSASELTSLRSRDRTHLPYGQTEAG